MESGSEGYEELKDEIRDVQYSAILDADTCDSCTAADGEAGTAPDSITAVPNPQCTAREGCRCVHVFVFADEVR